MEKGRNDLIIAIVRAREGADLSQDEFGRTLNVSQQTVAKWESTGWIPSKHWELVKKLYGVDPGEYLERQRKHRSTIRARDNANIATYGGSVSSGRSLTPMEQTLIDELRDKDNDGKILRSMLLQLLQKK